MDDVKEIEQRAGYFRDGSQKKFAIRDQRATTYDFLEEPVLPEEPL